MPRFFLGLFAGLLCAALTLALAIRFLPNLLVVGNAPAPADAIFVLDGDGDGSRLRAAVKLYDAGLTPRLVHINGKARKPDHARKICPDCGLAAKTFVVLEGSTDTRTDAEIAVTYSREHNLRKILVVTSPYHTRRAQFIFNDVASDFRGQAPGGASPLEVTVVSSGGFEKFTPPDGRWWLDRRTLEFVWLELGKILYWELTPFMEFQGEGERLRESEKAK